jgi:hypothetical protein
LLRVKRTKVGHAESNKHYKLLPACRFQFCRKVIPV